MADVTYEEFQQRVAQKLQITAQGQGLAAEDAELIQLAAKSVNAQAGQAGLAFDIENGIDHTYVNAFAELVAAELVDDFQLPEPRRSMLKANGWGMPGRSPAERNIRRQYSTPKLSTDVDFVKQ